MGAARKGARVAIVDKGSIRRSGQGGAGVRRQRAIVLALAVAGAAASGLSCASRAPQDMAKRRVIVLGLEKESKLSENKT